MKTTILSLTTMMLLAIAASAEGKNPGLSADDNGPVKVSEEIQKLRLVDQVKPVYPELARLSKTEGSVTLQVMVNKDGAVTKVDVISGPPLLTRSATEAVKQWKYKPAVVNGVAVEVVTQVKINFAIVR